MRLALQHGMAKQTFQQGFPGAKHAIDDSMSVRLQAGSKVQVAAKAGWAAKGALYITLGVLALMAAFGEGGQTAGGQGVLQWVAQQSFGTVLLMLSGIGFSCYALWRFIQAIIDPESHKSEAVGTLKRIGWAASGLVHAGLAFASFQLATGSGSGGQDKQMWLSKALAQEWGPYFIGALAVFVIGVGLYQFKKAIKLGFMDDVNTGKMTAKEEKTFRIAGRLGLASRGVVFPIIGYFLMKSAIEANASAAQGAGVGGALDKIAEAGMLPLAIVAFGLVAYGVLQLFFVRYRNVSAA